VSGDNTEFDVNYPRPQLCRKRWADLNGEWGFAHDDDDRGFADRWFDKPEPFTRTITVPFPPESALSGVDEPGFHPVMWYRREIEIDEDDRGGRLMLHFGAVDYEAMVWVNGRLACKHEGGHTPFSAEIAHLLDAGPRQVITVRAQDNPFDLQQPRGKNTGRKSPAISGITALREFGSQSGWSHCRWSPSRSCAGRPKSTSSALR